MKNILNKITVDRRVKKKNQQKKFSHALRVGMHDITSMILL